MSASSSSNSSAGQVLGATTTAIGGVAMLPDTGSPWLAFILPMLAISLGSIVLLSFIITRVLIKLER